MHDDLYFYLGGGSGSVDSDILFRLDFIRKDSAILFRLAVAKDSAILFRQAVEHSLDSRTLFRLSPPSVDSATLFRLQREGSADSSVLFRIDIPAGDAEILFRLELATLYKDANVIFRMGLPQFSDSNIIYNLAVVQDSAILFRLGLPYLTYEQPSTVLSQPLAVGATTMLVKKTELFLRPLPFTVKIQDEALRVTARIDLGDGSEQWTVTRQYDSTPTETYPPGLPVRMWSNLWIRVLDGIEEFFYTYRAYDLSYTKILPGGDGEATWRIILHNPLSIPRPNSHVEIGDELGIIWEGRLENQPGTFRPSSVSKVFVARGYGSLASDKKMPGYYIIQSGTSIRRVFKEITTSLAPGFVVSDDFIRPLGRSMSGDSPNFGGQSLQQIYNTLASYGSGTDAPIFWAVWSRAGSRPVLEVFPRPAEDDESKTYSIDISNIADNSIDIPLQRIYNKVTVIFAQGIVVEEDTDSTDFLNAANPYDDGVRAITFDHSSSIATEGQARQFARAILARFSALRAVSDSIAIPYPLLVTQGNSNVNLPRMEPGYNLNMTGIDLGDPDLTGAITSQLISGTRWDNERRIQTLSTEDPDSLSSLIGRVNIAKQASPGEPFKLPVNLPSEPPHTVPIDSNKPPSSGSKPIGGFTVSGSSGSKGQPNLHEDPATGTLKQKDMPPGSDLIPLDFTIGIPDEELESDKIWGSLNVFIPCRIVRARIEILNQDGSTGSVQIRVLRTTFPGGLESAATVATLEVVGANQNEENWGLLSSFGDIRDRQSEVPANSRFFYEVLSATNAEQVTISFLARRIPDLSLVGNVEQPNTPITPTWSIVEVGWNYAIIEVTSGTEVEYDPDTGEITSEETGFDSQAFIEYGAELDGFDYGSTTPEVSYYPDAYGVGSSYDSQFQRTRQFILPGLVPDTTYHFRVHVIDRADGEYIGDDDTFTTDSDPAVND